jgi:hypothetical protein
VHEEETRVMEEYLNVIAKNTVLFSTVNAYTLLDCLLTYADEQGFKDRKLVKDKFKLKLRTLNDKK